MVSDGMGRQDPSKASTRLSKEQLQEKCRDRHDISRAESPEIGDLIGVEIFLLGSSRDQNSRLTSAIIPASRVGPPPLSREPRDLGHPQPTGLAGWLSAVQLKAYMGASSSACMGLRYCRGEGG